MPRTSKIRPLAEILCDLDAGGVEREKADVELVKVLAKLGLSLQGRDA